MLPLKSDRAWARSCTILGLGAALLLTPLQAAMADPSAYEVNDLTDLFGKVNLSTGAFTETSVLPFVGAGLAEIGSNLYISVFASSTNLTFYQLNPINGALTAISDTGLDGGEFLALGSTLNGIYALDSSFNLYSINPMTGAATLIGATGLSTLNPAYQLSTGSSTLCFGLANELYSLNTSTGAATDIGPTLLSGDGIDGLFTRMAFSMPGMQERFLIPPV